MQKITPFLWFGSGDDMEAAIALYTSVFPDGAAGDLRRYGEGGPAPAGTAMTGSFRLAGQEFMALNGGPQFKFTPAVSFFVRCESQQEVDAYWDQLSPGGETMIERGEYPFSPYYGWLGDRFGVSWQFSVVPGAQKICPFLFFLDAQSGRAEEAMRFYTGLFDDSAVRAVDKFGPGEFDTEGLVKQGLFTLAGREFIAVDSGMPHGFTFNEAISFFVDCKDQAEVDRLWNALIADGGTESMCGWLKDKFGVSWQIIPEALGRLMGDPDPDRARRVMQAMLGMRKIDVAGLQAAYDQA